MTGGADQKRLREALTFGAVALTALVIALALVVTSAVRQPEVERSGLVLPGFADQTGEVRVILIETRDARFQIERDGEGWALAGRAGYPADAELAERALSSLGELVYIGARTGSRNRHAELGLVDPRAGGEATRVTVRDFDDAVMADILIGAALGESGVYLRAPDDDRTFAARGVPAIAEEASRWMSLDFLALGVDSIARVHVQPERGPAYRLERPGISVRNFALRFPPGWRPVTDGASNGTGSVLGRVRFRDVRGSAFEQPAVATHSAETFGGLRVEISVFALAGERWATIRAVALTDDAEAEALALNNASDGWAFLLSDLTIERLIRPLDDFATRIVVAPTVQTESQPEN